MQLHIVSFSYKTGIPTKFDKIYDCRSLLNPYSPYRELNGLHGDVQEFVLKEPLTTNLIEKAKQNTIRLIEQFQPQIFIGFGCIGGKHRSVVLAETLGKFFRSKGASVEIFHRELRQFT